MEWPAKSPARQWCRGRCIRGGSREKDQFARIPAIDQSDQTTDDCRPCLHSARWQAISRVCTVILHPSCSRIARDLNGCSAGTYAEPPGSQAGTAWRRSMAGTHRIPLHFDSHVAGCLIDGRNPEYQAPTIRSRRVSRAYRLNLVREDKEVANSLTKRFEAPLVEAQLVEPSSTHQGSQ